MHRFWKIAIRPLLVALRAERIIEIGAAEGATSEPLLTLAAERGAVVDIIDPAPRFDEAALRARFGESLRVHRARSLDVLAEIGPVDAVLIDGDHNWYTVHSELRLLDSAAARGGRPFPLTFLHDVSWPYARRDMYHEPEAIPERWRQSWARRPVVWGRSELGEGHGLNEGHANALAEGTPCNGVLTAVEDFLEESELQLELRLIEGLAGLAVLVPTVTLDRLPALRRQWEWLDSAEFLHEHVRLLADFIAAVAGRPGAPAAVAVR